MLPTISQLCQPESGVDFEVNRKPFGFAFLQPDAKFLAGNDVGFDLLVSHTAAFMLPDQAGREKEISILRGHAGRGR